MKRSVKLLTILFALIVVFAASGCEIRYVAKDYTKTFNPFVEGVYYMHSGACERTERTSDGRIGEKYNLDFGFKDLVLELKGVDSETFLTAKGVNVLEDTSEKRTRRYYTFVMSGKTVDEEEVIFTVKDLRASEYSNGWHYGKISYTVGGEEHDCNLSVTTRYGESVEAQTIVIHIEETAEEYTDINSVVFLASTENN